MFLAFSAIFVTLVLQGTTLGPLIRRLSIEEPAIEAPGPDIVEARKDAAAAALEAISTGSATLSDKDVADELIEEFKGRAGHDEPISEQASEAAERRQAQMQLRLAAVEAARAKLVERRDEMDGETLDTLVHELDLEEAQTRIALVESSADTSTMPRQTGT